MMTANNALRRPSLGFALKIAFLVGMSLFFIYPLFYSLGVTFMGSGQFQTEPPGALPIPKPLTFHNLKYILMLDSDAQYPIGRWYANTIVRVIWYVGLNVSTSLIIGFVFARMRFRGKGLAFAIMMVTTLLPSVITFTPIYLLMVRFPLLGGNNILGVGGTGILNTYSALLILGILNINAIFLTRMSIASMPRAMEEAAYLDGASLWTIMFKIVFPMQKSILAYIAITCLIGTWNDWYTPFVFEQDPGLQSIASGMVTMTNSFIASKDIIDWPQIIAQGLAINIPCLVIYIAFQKQIIAGLTSSAIKG